MSETFAPSARLPALRIYDNLDRAEAALGRGELRLAARHCRAVLDDDEENSGALHLLAVIANKARNAPLALQAIDRALAADPQAPHIQNTRGIILTSLYRLEEAEEQLQRCVAQAPWMRQAWSNLVAVKAKAYDLEAAMTRLEAFEARFPPDAISHCLRASLHQARGDHEAALAAYDAAIALEPDNIDAGFARANLLLLMGRFAEGWVGFELRRRRPLGRQSPIERPAWNGEPTPGTRLLVYAEDGLGDVFQFARYLPGLVEQGLKVFSRLSGLAGPAAEDHDRPGDGRVQRRRAPPIATAPCRS